MADKPVTVTLKGGPCDGKTLTLQHGNDVYMPMVSGDPIGDVRDIYFDRVRYSKDNNWNAVIDGR